MSRSYPELVQEVLSEYAFPPRLIDRSVGLATVIQPSEVIDPRKVTPWKLVPHQTLGYLLDQRGVKLSSRSLYRICDRLMFPYLKVSNARFYLDDDLHILCQIDKTDFPNDHTPFRLLKTVHGAGKLLGLSEAAVRSRSDYRGKDMYKSIELSWPGYTRRFWIVDPQGLTIATP